jgi:hypothetical protein
MRILAGGILLALLGGCGGGPCDAGALGASNICPAPVYGYAHVEIIVLHADATPVVGRQAFLSCGDVVGGYGELTDRQGRFVVSPVYSVADSILYPFPPRAPDGSFQVQCGASAEIRPNIIVRETFPLRFSPTRDAVTPSLIELREQAP